MKYKLDSGETVRVRTCNDHVLVVLADSAEASANLNIEGTDHLLIVMPETPRTDGTVIAYFVPTVVAVKAVRRSHAEWLGSNPSTGGNNRTWNVWFDHSGTSWGGFATKWSKYRIHGQVTTVSTNIISPNERSSLGAVIAEARSAIAEAAGVTLESVKISIELD